ncbi:MAG: hypothetical protein K8R64_03955 [Methanosarcinaceae archaeon]|nr:hypothetical protein [Methanosarcinaceae archaeon]
MSKIQMSQIQSALLSSTPIIEGNSVTLSIVKTDTKAYTPTSDEYTLTKCALESSADTWEGGIITVNHTHLEKGQISSAWFEDPFVYARLEGLSTEAVDAINSAAYRGVSQESQPVEVKSDKQITKLNGTGVTLVFFPETPACTMTNGCRVASSNFPC